MKMYMFCGLYSWSLTHKLCNPNNKTLIPLLVHSSHFGSESSYMECSCSRNETEEKLVSNIIHMYMCFSHYLYITM
ncbi:hypothetical protein N665_0034s0005 [Sinapis alba]|nr:hypothetical protein N665_0034s0005 [Sinapis alba]